MADVTDWGFDPELDLATTPGRCWVGHELRAEGVDLISVRCCGHAVDRLGDFIDSRICNAKVRSNRALAAANRRAATSFPAGSGPSAIPL